MLKKTTANLDGLLGSTGRMDRKCQCVDCQTVDTYQK